MRIWHRLTAILFVLLIVNSSVYAQTEQSPYPPQLKSVSVDPATNDVLLRWHIRLSPTSTIDHLVARKLENPRTQPTPINDPIGPAIPFPDSSVVIPHSAGTKADSAQQAFCLTAHPVNPLVNPSMLSNYHFTVFLKTSIDTCNARTVLKWTRYRSTNADLVELPTEHRPFNAAVEYEVWGYQGDPPFNQSLAVQLSQRTKDTVFQSQTQEKGKNYYYFIKAYMPQHEDLLPYGPEVSFSNRDSAVYQRLAVPTYINITRVESKESSVELNFTIDPRSELHEYSIERAADTAQDFSIIHSFSDKTTASYTDHDVNTNEIYYYRVSSIRCNAYVKQSNVASTILLSSERQSRDAYLKWTSPMEQSSTYSVTRLVPDNVLTASNLSGSSYTEDILQLIQQGYDRFCYRVTEQTPAYISISKPSCFVVETTVHMPDAIDPANVIVNANTGMQRNRFGPVIDMVDTMYGYELTIFNRWGKKVFETTKKIGEPLSVNHLWDGHYKGKLVEPGVYLYTITVSFTSSLTSLKGNVSVFY